MEIVGLKKFIPDDVNKLIFKFIGAQSKAAKAIKEEKRKWADANCLTDKGVENYLITLPEWLKGNARSKFVRVISGEFYKLTKIHSFDERQKNGYVTSKETFNVLIKLNRSIGRQIGEKQVKQILNSHLDQNGLIDRNGFANLFQKVLLN